MEANKTNTETKTPAKKEPVFSLDRLSKDCTELFGITPSTFAGATCSLKDPNKKYTVAEMKKLLDDWGNTPVYSKDRKAKEGK